MRTHHWILAACFASLIGCATTVAPTGRTAPVDSTAPERAPVPIAAVLGVGGMT